MRYSGGKSRLAPWIVDHVARMASPGAVYFEPFVGGGAVLAEVCRRQLPFAQIQASDLRLDLILMWKALQMGWRPPVHVSFEDWTALKTADPSPLRAYAGFACSFGGVWFASYARGKAGDDESSVQRPEVVVEDALPCRRVKYSCRSYDLCAPKPNDVVYCDIPYQNTDAGAYRGLPAFDHSLFWLWADSLVRSGVRVLVSEFTGPALEGWLRIDCVDRLLTLNAGQHKSRVAGDTLWVHESQVALAMGL